MDSSMDLLRRVFIFPLRNAEQETTNPDMPEHLSSKSCCHAPRIPRRGTRSCQLNSTIPQIRESDGF